ncbi:hypothetical protein ACROYT_G038207 [Oculina patagonica]
MSTNESGANLTSRRQGLSELRRERERERSRENRRKRSEEQRQKEQERCRQNRQRNSEEQRERERQRARQRRQRCREEQQEMQRRQNEQCFGEVLGNQLLESVECQDESDRSFEEAPSPEILLSPTDHERDPVQIIHDAVFSAVASEEHSQVFVELDDIECSLLSGKQQSDSERFYQQGRLSQDVADAAQDLEKDMENMNPVSVAMTAINTGEEFQRENPVLEDDMILEGSNLVEARQPVPEMNSNRHLEDIHLISRARAVGVAYEFAKPGSVETADDRRKRQRRNQRRVSDEERRLREVVGDLPPPPPAGSSQLEDNAYVAIRAFEVEQMTYKFSCCEICQERRLEGKGTGNMCSRCRRDKKDPECKVWSDKNKMDPMSVPEELPDMSDAEQMLISRLAPTVHVHMLKHGGIASRGHCIAFPQAVQEPATILPRLPEEVDIIRVRRQGKDDTHKEFRVRRRRVESALRWLKVNNPAYGDIEISDTRLQNLPADGELPNLRTVEFSETADHMDDQGPAPEQLDAGETDSGDDMTVSGVILPEPGVNVQACVEAAINEVVSEPPEAEAEAVERQQGTERPVISWPSIGTTPASEFTTPYFFTMAFPCLFPYGKGDFHINRRITCPSLHDWAEHLLWYKDGRFARHKVWKFVVHNMIMRKRALEQSRYIVDQQLGDPQLTVGDLQERLASGDNTFINKLLYFGANLRGTAQYWHQRWRELRALVEFMVNEKKGLPSFFMTGSCAEFYFPPLRRLLEQYILQTTGKEVNLDEDSSARYKAVQENTHVVVNYFDLRTQSYHKKVLKPVFGVHDYWYRYEFAKSRGQIHWHQLSWRVDRQPHQLLHEAREDDCDEDECAAILNQWADENLAMTALHPGGSDEEGKPRKDLWPPPEGSADPISDERDPLVKMLMDIASTQDAILEDHLLLVNRVGLHSCSDYCLRTPRHPGQGLQPNERVCRMEFGSEFHPGKKLRNAPEIVNDHNGAPRLEMPRDHRRVVQHSRYQLQSWRANGDISLILSNSSPDNPSTDDIIAIIDYVCGYACKDSEPTGATADLFEDMVNAVDSSDAGQVSGKSICAKMLIKTVGRRDISGPEASFELSGLALWRCSRQFSYLSMTGSRRLERDGDTATRSTPLDKYLARSSEEHCSWYQFASQEGKVPVVSGGSTHASWPLNEDYCRTMLLLHWPNWFDIQEVKGDAESWVDRFKDFVVTDECPLFVKAQASKAQRYAEHTQEPVFEDDVDDNADEAEEQPDWVDVYAGQNQRYEGVEKDFDYDDGGEQYNWSSISINLPEGKDPKKWLEESIKEDEEQEMEVVDLELPDVSPLSLNDDQRAIVSLVLHTLYNLIENQQDYHPLRLVVAGTAGTGKSYVIKCLQKLVRQVFRSNDAIQVITPTGNSAYLVQGTTAHSFLRIPTGGRSSNELTVPSGSVLQQIQDRCENLKVLVGDERSMFGRTTVGWMEQHTRYAINRGANSEELLGGIPVVVLMGDDVQLPPVCDTPVYIEHNRSAPSNHGRLVWTSFDSAVELTQIVRQTESEQQLRDVLMSMRTYSTTHEQVRWLQQFQWHNLRMSHGPELLHRLDEQGLYVFPTHRLEWERNKAKLLELNREPNHPVAKIKSVDNGRHAQKADSNKAGGLLPLLYLCRDSKVMLTVNLKAAWGLYNGAVGTVVDIVYKDGCRPTDDPPPLPDVVFVRFAGYKGPPYIDDDPTLVPIVPVVRSTDCACRCKRSQVPFRLSWGTTIHKCQGLTVGSGEAFRYVVIHPGKHDFEAKNPGALFVALSRAKSAGGDGVDPDFAFHEDVLLNDDRLKPVNTPTTRARAAEMERLQVLAYECTQREALAAAYHEETFLRLVEWAQSQRL